MGENGTSSSNGAHNRIAKNTLFLYLRMLITMGVSLYTSRVLLDTLGIEDYGIYNIVGGVVIMFSVLNTSLSGATSRFLTYELGSGNSNILKRTFASAFLIHLFVALFIFILAETIGLWFVYNKLLIPSERFNSALIAYQFSILSSLISITQVPYNAAIIAHERMSIYAYVSIFEAILKLLIVYILVIGQFDKLVLYSILMFIASLIIASIYRIYCTRRFEECRMSFKIERSKTKAMIVYSGWDLYGNLSVMVRGQGVNILLNLFFGAVINAATGITTQVQNVIDRFADNFLTAVKPQIVKCYALGHFDEMKNLINNSAKFSYCLLFFMSLPLILESSFVLSIWLKEVPYYTVVFCQTSLLNGLTTVMFRPIMYSIHATGKVKRMSLINGTIYLSTLPISYFLLKQGYPPITPYIINIILMALGSISNLLILKKYLPLFSILSFLSKVIVPICFITLMSIPLPLFLLTTMKSSWIRFILICIACVISIGISVFTIGLNKDLRSKLFFKLRNIVNG